MNYIFEKFTSRARLSLATARWFSQGKVEPIHLLLGILIEEGSLGKNILKAHNVSLKQGVFLPSFEERLGLSRNYAPKAHELTESSKLALKQAMAAASKYRSSHVGTEYLLLGILRELKKHYRRSQKDITASFLEEPLSEGKIDKILTHLQDILEGVSQVPRMKRSSQNRGSSDIKTFKAILRTKTTKQQSSPPKLKTLGHFAQDLTEMAERGELDPVIGRAREVSQLIRILIRKQKNNPLLVGEPGVGKTALVQGLVQRIVRGEVPEQLAYKRIFLLDLGSLVAGTVFRGEFEARMKEILREAVSDQIIIFIDEIHTLIGAGSAQGALDAANLLKPALSQGTIQMIGATTFEEYRKYFANDRALERRFQPIFIQEPTIAETRKILQGLRPRFEKHHGVKIDEEIIEEVIRLAGRYLTERYFPDKAIDVLDEACAHVVSTKNRDRGVIKKIRQLEGTVKKYSEKKTAFVHKSDYKKALVYQEKEQAASSRLEKLLDKMAASKTGRSWPSLSLEDLKYVVAENTGVPLEHISASLHKKLARLKENLSRSIVGQGEVVNIVSRTIKKNLTLGHVHNRALASFLFLGPSGVGKTETARQLAEHMYSSPESLIKLDMSEFSQSHTIARLVGAPAGYVGYGEGGELTERVRRHPYSLVLFDEIEKAHPNLHNLLLQILEDGVLTDAQGRRIDFRNTTLVLTANIGSELLTGGEALGFGKKNDLKTGFEENKKDVLHQLREILRPELINRLDHIIVFNQLTLRDIKKILLSELRDFQKLVLARGIKLQLDDKLLDQLAKEAYDPLQGARKVRKVIADRVENLVAHCLFKEKNPPKLIKIVKRSEGLKVIKQ